MSFRRFPCPGTTLYCTCTRYASIKGCQDERGGPGTCSVLAAWQALVAVCYRVFPLQSVALLCHHMGGTRVNTVLGKRYLQCVALCHTLPLLQSVAFLRQDTCGICAIHLEYFVLSLNLKVCAMRPTNSFDK